MNGLRARKTGSHRAIAFATRRVSPASRKPASARTRANAFWRVQKVDPATSLAVVCWQALPATTSTRASLQSMTKNGPPPICILRRRKARRNKQDTKTTKDEPPSLSVRDKRWSLRRQPEPLQRQEQQRIQTHRPAGVPTQDRSEHSDGQREQERIHQNERHAPEFSAGNSAHQQ